MQVRVIQCDVDEYVYSFQDSINEFLNGLDGGVVFKMIYDFQNNFNTVIIHYHTEIEVRKLKINKLLDPEIEVLNK